MRNIDENIMAILFDNLSKYSEFIKDGFAIAIYTVDCNVQIYTAKMYAEEEKEQMYSNIITNMKDTIKYIVCVIGKELIVDIPPYHLRRMLCEVNEKNNQAKIIMNGINGLKLKKMKDTF